MPKRAGSLGIIGTALAVALLLPIPSNSQASADTDAVRPAYELGRGLALGTSGVTLGGYLTAEARRVSGASSELTLSHASVFVWWEPGDHLKVFAEVDQRHAVASGNRRVRPGEPPSRRASLERLHATWTFNDALALRAGKFLTPVGRWNLVHADPLVWTTSRPLLTAAVYARNVTGLMASGTLPWADAGIGWSVYGSNGSEWRGDPFQDLFARVRGGRITWPFGGAWLAGLSWADYEQRATRGEQRELRGVDLAWAAQGWEISAEWLRTATSRSAPPPLPPGPGSLRTADARATPLAFAQPPQAPRNLPTRGAYVQAVAPLHGALFGVLRIERLRDTGLPQGLTQRTIGLAWRPATSWSIKIEHQSASARTDLAPRAWTASASVLF